MKVHVELFGQLLPGCAGASMTLDIRGQCIGWKWRCFWGLNPEEIGLITINGVQSELEDPVPPDCRLVFLSVPFSADKSLMKTCWSWFRNSRQRMLKERHALTERLKGSDKSFGGLKAINNLDFDVDEGEIVGIIGPNGSGKTTALNLLTGFLKPNSGKITFQGRISPACRATGLTRRVSPGPSSCANRSWISPPCRM